MIARYRWYSLKIPKAVTDIAQVILNRPLREDSQSGFSIADGEESSRFRFFWRTRVVVTLFDESGAPSYQQISSVEFTDFAIVKIRGRTYLRVENPGRSTRELLNALELALGFGFFCSPLTFEDVGSAAIFCQIDSVKLVGLKVVGAVVSEGLVARIELVAKQGMVEKDIQILEKIKYKVEQAAFEIIFRGIKGQIALSSNGLVRLTGHLSPKLLGLIEKSLPALSESAQEKSVRDN